MLRMRIERAPLAESANEAILTEYNRLTGAEIPINEFVHWLNASPAGKAWHAILESEDGQIAGHTSVFPVRTSFSGAILVPAKSEYSVVRPEFRKEKIIGYEKAGKAAFIILLDKLFQHCREQGWGPIFASTNEKNQVFTRKVGLRPLEFPLWECMLVLKPADASRLTPHLTDWQRKALFSAGIAQSTWWNSVAPIFSRSNGIHEIEMQSDRPVKSEKGRLAFFEDFESMRWRYLGDQYVRLELEQADGDYLIAKRGSPSRYLRVCQWHIESVKRQKGLVNALVRIARRDGALGVRWAIYDGETTSDALVNLLRWSGFLTARRTRIMMVHNAEEAYLNPAMWKINDSLFSFDP
jgi:hypothetical protein